MDSGWVVFICIFSLIMTMLIFAVAGRELRLMRKIGYFRKEIKRKQPF